MEIKYFLADPTGNITGLVESPVSVEHQPEIAEMIMNKEPSCEQVGFIMDPVEGSDITLRMAGGEFCGNATMTIAAYFCSKNDLQDNAERDVNVKVIGTTGIFPVRVKRENEIFYGTIMMPKPISISEKILPFENHNYRYPVVEFTGISHVVIEDNVPVYLPEGAIKLWADRLKVKGIGLMLLNKEKTEIRPLVYVKEPESLVWESSCASGTTAVTAYLSSRPGGPKTFSFKEPGGTLKTSVDENGNIFLTGKVIF